MVDTIYVEVGSQLDDKSPTLVNLENDHGFIIKDYYLPLEAESKAMRAYVQSEQYHTIVENHVLKRSKN